MNSYKRLYDTLVKNQNSMEEGILGKLFFRSQVAQDTYDVYYNELRHAIKDGDVAKARELYDGFVEEVDELKQENKKWAKEFIIVQDMILKDYKKQIDALCDNDPLCTNISEDLIDDSYDDLDDVQMDRVHNTLFMGAESNSSLTDVDDSFDFRSY